MKRRLICLWAAICLCGLSAAWAEPLKLGEDLTAEIRVPLNDGADYVYRYRYPQADPSDPSAELINSFFQYKAEDAEGFEIPMNADYYRGLDPREDVMVEVDYQVTCNGENFFSALVTTRQGELTTCAGYTFSRKDLKPGLSVALPYLLGLLDSGETDTWLQDRQTAKADALVRELVWENLEEREGKDLALTEGMEEEVLEYLFFPEEDFYLDETENPVFYLQPGFAEESGALITVPISIETILDEM